MDNWVLASAERAMLHHLGRHDLLWTQTWVTIWLTFSKGKNVKLSAVLSQVNIVTHARMLN